MKLISNLAYGPNADNLIDIYLPDAAPRAALVYFHGGGLENGSKDVHDCLRLAEELTPAGVAVAAASYRKYPAARFPEFIEDAAAAAAFVIRHGAEYGLDCPVYVGGSSAGGYLTGMLCFARRYLAAEGITPEAFAGFVLDAGQPTTHFRVLAERGEDPRRCVVDEAAMLWHIKDASPARPLFIIYADNDMPARKEQNLLLRATLIHMGYDPALITMREMQGWSHCGYVDSADGEGRGILGRMILEFIDGTDKNG